MRGAEDRAVAAEDDRQVGVDRARGSTRNRATRRRRSRCRSIDRPQPIDGRAAFPAASHRRESSPAVDDAWRPLTLITVGRAILSSSDSRQSTGRLARPTLDLAMRTASGRDAGGVEAQVGEQFAAFAVFDEVVGDAQAANAAGVEAGIGGGFQHGRAEAAHQRAFFDRDDETAVANRSQHNRFGIERLDERALITPTSSPSSRSSRAASRHAGSKCTATRRSRRRRPRTRLRSCRIRRACVRRRSCGTIAFG